MPVGSLGVALVAVIIIYAPIAFVLWKLGVFIPKSVKIVRRAKQDGTYAVGSLKSRGLCCAVYEYEVDGTKRLHEVESDGVVIPKSLTLYWKSSEPGKIYTELQVVDGFVAKFFTLVPIALWLIFYIVLGVAVTGLA